MTNRIRLAAAATIMACASTNVQAESISVSGWYAAENRDVAMLYSLSVDRFQGEDGPMLASAIERAFRDVRARGGGRYFDIVSGGYNSRADGRITGSAQVRVETTKFKRKVKRCAADTSSTDCKDADKVEIEIKCERRIISLAADVRIVRIADGTVLYSRDLPQRNESDYCEGDKLPPGVDTIVAPMFTTIANQVREQNVPYGRTQKVRIRESRSGLSKPDSAEMKGLIQITDKNPAQACAGWKAMEARGLQHPTLTFNLGLCAEAAGDLDTAMRYYQDAAAEKSASDVREAVDRVARRLAGEEDDRRREEMRSQR